MDPLRLKVNLTTTFMLPILCDKNLKHSDILTDTFINTYIADLNKPEQDDKLIVRYATITDLPIWTTPYAIYTEDSDVVIGNVMVPYEVPESLVDEYGKFLTGDYSKFSDKYKEQILKFWEANEDTLLYGIIYKKGQEIKDFVLEITDVDLDMSSADTEYWKPPNLKQEIFGIEGN